MKYILFLLLMISAPAAFAQTEVLQKGKAVYIQQASVNDEVKDYKEELKKQLEDWGYWKVVADKAAADFILDLNVDSHKGITATSWGGRTVIVDALLHTKDGEKLFQTEKHEVSPNGLNGFNGGKAAVKKLVKGLRKKFQ